MLFHHEFFWVYNERSQGFARNVAFLLRPVLKKEQKMATDPKKNLVDGKYTIRELVDLKKLRGIFQHFTDTMGFTIGFLSVPDMEILIATGWRDICTQFHRKCPRGAENCRKSNVRLTRQMTKPGKVVIEACANGLVDCAMPIFIKGKCVAILATGQVLLKAPDLQWFRRQAKLFGCNEKKYMAALSEIPVIPEKRLKQVTGFLQELASLVAELGYAGLKEKEKSEELAKDIDKRKKTEIALKETTAQLQALYGAVTDGVLVADAVTKKILKASASACHLFGYTEKEFLEKTIYDLHPAQALGLIMDAFNSQIRKTTPLALDIPCRKKGGSLFFVDIAAKPGKFRGKKCLVGFFRDITERKLAKERESETSRRLQAVFDSAFQLIALLEPNGKVLEVNHAALQFGGLTARTVHGKFFWACRWWKLSTETRRKLRQSVSQAAKGQFVRYAVEILGGKGVTMTIDFSLKPVRNENGKVVLLTAEGRDITESKKMEQALLLRETETRDLMSNLPGMAYRCKNERDWPMFFVSEGCLALTGYRKEDFEAQRVHFNKLIDPRDRSKVWNEVQKALREKRHFEFTYRIRVKSGKEKWVWERGHGVRDASGRLLYLDGFISNVTEQKYAEDAMRVSEGRYRGLITLAVDGILTGSHEGVITEANEVMCALTGMSREALVGKHIDQLPFMKESLRRSPFRFDLLQKNKVVVSERAIRRSDGAVIDVEMRTKMMPDGSYQSIFRDITARKNAEKTILANEERLRSIYSNMNEGLALHEMVYDAKGRAVDYRIIAVNRAYEKHVGLRAQRVLGKLASVVYGKGKGLAPYLEAYSKVAAGRSSVSFDAYFAPLKRHFHISAFSPKLGQFATVFSDITERKCAEERLRTSESRFRSYFELPLHGIAITSPGKQWLQANDRLCSLLGYNRKELFLKTWSEMTHPDDLATDTKQFQRMLSGKIEQYAMEKRFIRKDGKIIWTSLAVGCVRKSDGKVDYVCALIDDITERVRAVEALKESESQRDLALQASRMGVWQIDLIHNKRYFDKQVCRLLGIDFKTFSGKAEDFFKRIHPEDRLKVKSALTRSVTKDVPYEPEYRVVWPDQSIHYVAARGKLLRDSSRRPWRMNGVIWDITESKKAEEALRESEKRFSIVINNSLDLVYRRNIQTGRYDFFSSVAKQILGFSPEELLGKDLSFALKRIHPDDLKSVTSLLRRVHAGKIKSGILDYRCKHKNGSYRWLSDRFTIVNDAKGRPLYWVGVSRDITMAKGAEEALRESEKRYRLLTENSSDVIWTMNSEGAFTYVSPTTYRLRGYTADEVMRQPLEKQIAPGSLPFVLATLKTVLEKGWKGIPVPPMVADVEQLRKNGSTVWTEISLEVIRERENKSFMLLGVTRDITERKRAEALLKQREAYLTSIIENQPGMIWLKDKESRILAANRVYARMTGGKDPQAVVGKTDLDFWPAKLANKFRADDRHVMETGKPIVTEELISEKGALRWHETFKTPVFDEKGKVIGTTGYAQDITERKTSEALLRASEARLQLQFTSMPIGAILWDTRLCVLSWNPAAEKIFGYSESEATGQRAYDFILPVAVKSRIRKIWSRLLQGNRTAHSINENITKNGKTILCRWTNTPLRGNDGKVFGVLSMVEDITMYTKAEEALRESERSLRESQAIAGVGSYTLDIPRKVWKSSAVLDDVFGIPTSPEHSVAEWESLMHPDWRIGMRDYLMQSVVRAHGRFDKEYKIVRPRDGKERWVHGLGELEFDSKGRPVRMIGTVMDVTERKELEQALEKRILALTQPEGGLSGIEFEDLFNIEEIQKIQDEFTKATGVASIITHADGTPITKPSNFCRLCNDIIRKTEKGRVNCYRSDACIGRLNPEGPIIQTCLSGGLWDAGASITVGGRHVANWLIGQVRDEAQSEEKIRAYARKIGADEQKAAEAFREVPPMPRVQFNKVSQLLFTMAKQLSQFAYQNLQQARAITESRRAEAMIRGGRRRLFQVIDTVPHMIYAKDKRGRFLLVNRAVGEMYGKTPQELIGALHQDIHKVPDEVEHLTLGNQEVLVSGKPMLVSNEPFTDVQGRKHILQTIKIPFNMPEEKELCVLGVSVDVTEQRKVEEFRNDIVRTVSHELRTPLSIEKEGISLLLDGMLGPISGVQTEILETVMRSIDRLSRMITSLLDISSIETGKIVLLCKMMNLADIVKDVAFEFKKRAAEKGVDLSVKLPRQEFWILADSDKVMQVLSNLVDNAIKFTPSKGAVEISLSVSKEEVACEVRDTGIGIAAENLSKMFEKFQQFSRTAGPGEKGFGLGLSIAKGIVELHRGRIWVKSEPGLGTRVTFTLPLRGPDEAEGVSKDAESHPKAGARLPKKKGN